MERMLILFFSSSSPFGVFLFWRGAAFSFKPQEKSKTLEGFSQSFSALQMIGEYSFLSIFLLSPQDPLALFWV